MAREQWFIKNETNRYISVGDLQKLPALWPGKVIDVLKYYEQDSISNSSGLKHMLNLGWLSITKIKNNQYEKYNETNKSNESVTTAELTDIEEDSPSNTYGSMTNGIATTISIPIADEWVESDTNWTVGYTNKVLFKESHHLVVSESGKYEVNLSSSIDGTSGDDVGVAVMVNGTAQTAGHGHATAVGANDVSVAQNVIIDIAAGDEISVSYINHTAARDITSVHASIVIHRLGT